MTSITDRPLYQKHTIPEMTDPLGLHWIQPPRELIEIDDTSARMSTDTFEQLSEYSTSHPSGVYPGKMWRRLDGQFTCHPDGSVTRNPLSACKWLLVWYGDETTDHRCPILFREVVLT